LGVFLAWVKETLCGGSASDIVSSFGGFLNPAASFVVS